MRYLVAVVLALLACAAFAQEQPKMIQPTVKEQQPGVVPTASATPDLASYISDEAKRTIGELVQAGIVARAQLSEMSARLDAGGKGGAKTTEMISSLTSQIEALKKHIADLMSQHNAKADALHDSELRNQALQEQIEDLKKRLAAKAQP
jgi:hypothetical protein